MVGLSHWNARQVDEKRNYFTEDRSFGEDDKDVWNWGPRVRARVKHEIYPDFLQLSSYPAPETMELTQHMMAWTRVDFLMQRAPDGFRTWLDVMRDPFPQEVTVTDELLLQRQIKALDKAWGLTPDEFDSQWAAWAAKHYPKK